MSTQHILQNSLYRLLHVTLFLFLVNLIIFFVSLVIFLLNLSTTLANIILVLLITTLALYVILTAFFYDCPYKMSLTSILLYLTYVVAKYCPNCQHHDNTTADFVFLTFTPNLFADKLYHTIDPIYLIK